jgi:hypothetical protein
MTGGDTPGVIKSPVDLIHMILGILLCSDTPRTLGILNGSMRRIRAKTLARTLVEELGAAKTYDIMKTMGWKIENLEDIVVIFTAHIPLLEKRYPEVSTLRNTVFPKIEAINMFCTQYVERIEKEI